MSVQVVLYEGAGSQPLEPAERGAMMRALLEKGYPVESVRAGGVANLSPGAATVVLGKFDGPLPRLRHSTSATSTAPPPPTFSPPSIPSARPLPCPNPASGNPGSRSSITSAAPTACSA